MARARTASLPPWTPSLDSRTAASPSAPFSLLSPKLAARLFLLDPKSNPQLPYLGRLFGSREIALGMITLAAPE